MIYSAFEMDSEHLLKALSDSDKSTVIRHALPGIDAFLKEILSGANLPQEAEQLRLQYLDILESEGTQEKFTDKLQNLRDTSEKESETTGVAGQKLSLSGDPDNEVNRLDADALKTAELCNSGDTSELPASPELHRKGTGDTHESGVSVHGESWQTSHPVVDTHSPTSQTSTEGDTILSDVSADFEVVDWESDATNGNEEGYCTGDNMCLESSVQNFEIRPNELGELYTGVLYIREYPGWHKRWFTINDHCLKCYQHRTETKMLLEIPLKGARIIPMDRKKSRVFPIVLSVPKIKESITFAATEEHVRQQWKYVLNYVIRRLEDSSGGGTPGNESKISLDSLLKGKSVYHLDEAKQSVCLNEEHEQPCVQAGCSSFMPFKAEESKQQNETENVSENLKNPASVDRNQNRKNPNLGQSLVQWQVNIEAEDELMEPSAMAEDESFRELQECLPEILQGRKSHVLSPKKEVKRVFSTGDLPGSVIRPPSPSRRSMLSTSSSEGTTTSTSDLHSTTKVKRQTSLANSLSSKASRVKSRITGSFFKKGKKDEDRPIRTYTSKSTTFSGYLLRMKGSLWKSRWCVVKEHSLFCYKDFGVGAAELDIYLPGKSVECIAESDAKKPFIFVISTEKESYQFAAENDAELEEWLMVLKDETKLAEEQTPPGSTGAIPEVEGEVYTESPHSTRGRKFSPTWKKDKSITSVSGKKSILSSIGHKFGKTKTKVPQSDISGDSMKSCSPVEVETGFVIVQPTEISSDNAALVERAPLPQLRNNLEVPNPSMSGFLHQRVHSDTWLKCWVKLENHFLHIHDDKDREEAVVVKFKLSNCVVLDCFMSDRPHIMEIRRSRSQPIYLQAESQEEYDQWKATITESVIESPLPARRTRPLPVQSSLEDCQISPQLRLPTGGESFEQEDVFKTEGDNARLNLPLNPSPRPSTAGDVSSVESEEDATSLDTSKPEENEKGATRLRSFSEGEQDEDRTRNKKSQTRIRRSLSNALSSLDVTSAKNRRNKTLSGIKVPPEMLVNIRHTSCLYLRNNKGLWAKRWAILQKDKLHLFKRADDTSPCVSVNVEGCEVRQTSKKTKKFAFELSIPAEKVEYCLAADNHKELLTWIDLLQVNPRDKEKIHSGLLQEASRPKTSREEAKELQHSEFLEVPQRKIAAVNAENIEEPGMEFRPTGNGLTESETTGSCVSSPGDVRRSGECVGASEKSDSSLHHSREMLQQNTGYEKPASLEAVLRLLQDQQLVQQIGQRRFEKAKKVQNAWKRSALAAREASKDQTSRPDSPDGDYEKAEPVRRRGSSAGEGRYRNGSGSQRTLKDLEATQKQTSVDIIEQFEKLAEEEKQRALKKETLLKKRRNSLNLEKDVLERKIVKGQEKKSSTMKKLLGKEETDNKEDLAPTEKRLGDVHHELENIERDIDQNRRQQTEVLENLNTLKTRTIRKFSFRSDPNSAGSRTEERRAAFRSSPSESASSQGSVEDRTGREVDSLPITPDPSRKKSGVETLAALEQELRKYSPVPRRAPDFRKKRVSISSEGTASPDDASSKGSPTPMKKSDGRLTEPAGTTDVSSAGSQGGKSPINETLLDSTELRRKRFSASSRVSFHQLSVDIPTDDESHQKEAENTANNETSSESNSQSRKQKTSLVDALSQIKDFEDFAAGSLKYGNAKVL